MMKKKLLAFLIVFFSLTFNSFSIEPDIFVQSTVNRASKLLGEDISKDEKIEKLKEIAKEKLQSRDWKSVDDIRSKVLKLLTPRLSGLDIV